VSYWLLAVPVVVTLGAEAYFFVDGFIPPLVIGLLAAIVAVFLVHWSTATIEVTGTVLRAGGDTLALTDADRVLALDERQSAQLRGPKGDPAAHLLLRPYLKRAVYVGLADQTEGVPYWLVATRHPEELAAAIERGMAPGDEQAGDTQAGDTQAGDTQAGDTQAGDTGAGDAQMTEAQAAGGQADHGRAPGHQAGNRESVG
jgi:Protein of unknown function (DUF3093)